MISQGPYLAPIWDNVAGINENLQAVLNNGNSATESINLTGAVNLIGTSGELNLDSTSFITLNTDRGVAGQVLISGGPVGFPSWSNAGSGTITNISKLDTTYIDTNQGLSSYFS